MKTTRGDSKKATKKEPAPKKARKAPVQIPVGYDLLPNLKSAFPHKADLIEAFHLSMSVNRGGALREFSKAKVFLVQYFVNL